MPKSSDNQIQQSYPGTKYVSSFLIVITLVLGVTLGLLAASLINGLARITSPNNSTTNTFYDSEYLDEIYSKLVDEYIGEIPDKEQITQGMVKGLIQSLDDQYTIYLTPEEAEDYINSRNPDFEGIGVTLQFSDNNTTVESVLSGYSAEKAGILAGDIVLEVDGLSVEGETPSIVASKIRGEKDTEVKVKVFRPQTAEELDFTMQRVRIELSNINYKELGDGIYEINVVQFIDESVDEFNRTWDKIVDEISQKDDLKGIVIDLRNNPGGYVFGVKYVLEEFLDDRDVLFYEESNASGKMPYYDSREGAFEDVPLVVLVNEGSASASEIFAAAIIDNNRGEVVGMPTVGKGVEQKVVSDLSDSGLLIVVFQKWLTPNGRNIDKENPVLPDFEVDYTLDDFNAGIDTQLNKALELLR